ncbi:MAG: methylmalonyl-CoA mutase family protein [Bacteroidales bacterium]
MTKNRLFDEFPGISSEAWRDKVNADLCGAAFGKKLVWRTGEGFDLQPYYRQEDLEKLSVANRGPEPHPFTGRLRNDWKIRQDFAADPDPASLHRKIKNAIGRGAEAIGIDMSGMADSDPEVISSLLNGIDMEKVELNFKNLLHPKQFYKALTGTLSSTGTDPSAVSGSLGLDPLGKLLAEGNLDETSFDILAELIREGATGLPGFKILTIDAGLLQDCGSTLSQELGFGLSMANEYFNQLTGRGVEPGTIMKSISFSFATGPNYFMEIAKLRAARWLWMACCHGWEVEGPATMHIHARTSSWNLTLYDPNVNMLRTTTEAMSASLGGCNSMSVHPFDYTFREENEFTARIARNTQVILKEEAHFDKVSDPAAGSYYIEQLTESIAQQSWNHFLEIEEREGFLTAFKDGWVVQQVEASAVSKQAAASAGRDTILGVNKYPDFRELVLKQGVHTEEYTEPTNSNYKPLKRFRISAEIEQLRLQTEKSGERPRVFLLKYGDPDWMTARGRFAGNFFACAGYEILDNHGFSSVEEGMKVAGKANADIIVLCSSDPEYAETAPQVFDALKNSAEIVIAGYPADSMEELQQKGIAHFIHVKSNLLGELEKFQSIIRTKKNRGDS